MSGREGDPVLLTDDDTTLSDHDMNNGGPDKSDGPEEYVVEAIRARRKDPDTGCDVFLIKWEDYPETANTWEPAENLSCPEIVEKFIKDEASKRKRKRVDKPHSTATPARSKSQPVKRPRRSDGAKSRLYDDDDDTEDDYDSLVIMTSQKQMQTAKEATPEPVVKGFERALGIEKILTASIGDDDKMYFFIKWQGFDELELLSVDELEKNAPYELCRWYRERFFAR